MHTLREYELVHTRSMHTMDRYYERSMHTNNTLARVAMLYGY